MDYHLYTIDETGQVKSKIAKGIIDLLEVEEINSINDIPEQVLKKIDDEDWLDKFKDDMPSYAPAFKVKKDFKISKDTIVIITG